MKKIRLNKTIPTALFMLCAMAAGVYAENEIYVSSSLSDDVFSKTYSVTYTDGATSSIETISAFGDVALEPETISVSKVNTTISSGDYSSNTSILIGAEDNTVEITDEATLTISSEGEDYPSFADYTVISSGTVGEDATTKLAFDGYVSDDSNLTLENINSVVVDADSKVVVDAISVYSASDSTMTIEGELTTDTVYVGESSSLTVSGELTADTGITVDASELKADSITMLSDGDIILNNASELSADTITALQDADMELDDSKAYVRNLSIDGVELNNGSELNVYETLTSGDEIEVDSSTLTASKVVFNVVDDYVDDVLLSAENTGISKIEIGSLVTNLGGDASQRTTLYSDFYASGTNEGTSVDAAITLDSGIIQEGLTAIDTPVGGVNTNDTYTYYETSSGDTVALDSDGVVYNYASDGINDDSYTELADTSIVFTDADASSTVIGTVELNIGDNTGLNGQTITLGAADDNTTVLGDATMNISGTNIGIGSATINAGAVGGSTTLNVSNVFTQIQEDTTVGATDIALKYGTVKEYVEDGDGKYIGETYTTDIGEDKLIVTVTYGEGDAFTFVCELNGETITANSDGEYVVTIDGDSYAVSIAQDGTPTVVETYEADVSALVFNATVNDFDNVNISDNVNINNAYFSTIDNVNITAASFKANQSTFDTVENLTMTDVSANVSVGLYDVSNLTLSNFSSSADDAFMVSSSAPTIVAYDYISTDGENTLRSDSALTFDGYKYLNNGDYIISDTTLDSYTNATSATITYVGADGSSSIISGSDLNLTYYDVDGNVVTDDYVEIAYVIYDDGDFDLKITLSDLQESYLYTDAQGEEIDSEFLLLPSAEKVYDYNTTTINGNVDFEGTTGTSTAFYVDAKTELAGNISATYTYIGEDFETDSANITLNTIEANTVGIIRLSDVTVSSTIVDEDGNFLAYSNALTNDDQGSNGLNIYVDGVVTIYGNITANSPLTINGTTSDETGTLVVAGGVISANVVGGTDVILGSDLSVVLTTDDSGTMASFGADVDSLEINSASDLSVEAGVTMIAGETYDLFQSGSVVIENENGELSSITLPDGMSIDADGNLVVSSVSYFAEKATSGNALSLANAVDAITVLANDKDNIIAFKKAIDGNGLDSYLIGSNASMAEVNTMLLSNMNFANVNRARTILAKNAGAYIQSEEKATDVESKEVAQANSSLAQVQSINLLGSKDGDRNTSGYDYYSVGATANMDYFLADNLLAGVALGGVYNKVEGDAGDNANSTAFLLNAYAAYSIDSFELFANIGYAHFWNEGSKAGAGSADWDSDAFNVAIGASYAINTGIEGLKISPLAMFDIVFIDSDGASYANGVSVDSESYTSAKFILGIEAQYAFNAKFAATIKALYSFEMADTAFDNTYSITAGGYTLSNINFYGSEVDRSSAIIGAGLSYDFSENCSAYFDYTAYIYDALITHSLNLSVGFKF